MGDAQGSSEVMPVKHLKTRKGASLLLEAWRREYDAGPVPGTRCREGISPQPLGHEAGDSSGPRETRTALSIPRGKR